MFAIDFQFLKEFKLIFLIIKAGLCRGPRDGLKAMKYLVLVF